jgi:predicted acetyltransferase
VAAFVAAIETEFSFRFEPAARRRHEQAVDLERSLAVFERARVVATLSAYVVGIALPGGVSAQATALVDIGVVHERRGEGLARALVTAFCNQARTRGEALAVLNTDLVGLYERFGFGVATTAWSATLPAGRDGSPPDGNHRGQVHLIGASEAARVLPEIFADAQHHRVGEVLRTPQWWEEHLADAALARTPTEFAVIDEDGARGGYIAFVRPTTRPWAAVVAELVAADDGGSRALLAFVRGLTDGGAVRLRAQPFDVIAALQARAADREPSPQLWLRILDVAQALSARRYAAASRTVLAVRDELLAANRGRFLLETYGDGTASVTPSSDAAEITLDVADLGRIFLGGSTFGELAASGGIVASDVSVLTNLDRAFLTSEAPFCSTLL